MGRSNFAIMALGLGSMVVLSLLMQYVLGVADDRQANPALQELTMTYGPRVDGLELKIIDRRDRGAGCRAVVSFSPMMGLGERGIAREIGEYLWHRLGEERGLTAVEVISKPWGKDDPTHYDIPRPYMRRGRSGGATPPSPVAKPAPQLSEPSPK